MTKRKISKRTTDDAMAISVAIRPLGVKKTKSKKLWKNGMRKAPATMPMMVINRQERSRFSGFEIQ